MKLSFWQEGENSSEFYSRSNRATQNAQKTYKEELRKKEPYELLNENGERKLIVPGLQSVDVTRDCGIFTSLKNVKDEYGYKVQDLQQWCEDELTPLAWKRALVRTLPAMRELGYDLDELQHPSDNLRINHAYYQLICATLSELYHTENSVD